MLRRNVALVAATVAALSCVAPASAAAPTERLIYSPFATDGSLLQRLKVTTHTGGTCATGSYVVARAGTYRCFDGNIIRDPCFSDARASTAAGEPVVACVAAPWSRAVVSLHLADQPQSAFGARPGGPPWALQLASGARCVFGEGATSVAHGLRLNYFCGAKKLYLFGSPRTSRPTWRIHMAHNLKGRGWRLVAIARAWR
jgi:hypothetical protein